MIERQEYMEKIEKFIDKPLVKILTGIRRSGKSTILQLVRKKILDKGIEQECLVYVNFESMQFYDFRNSKALYAYIMDRVIQGKKMYLFFDEIQIVENWEEAINSFLVDLDVDIYITGSNSQLLSSELATLLTGRYVQFLVYPLSLKEVKVFHQQGSISMTDHELIWHFIRRGGFPSLYITDYDEKSAYTVISSIYDSIVLRDVVERHSIRDIELLGRIFMYLMDNVGSIFSAKSIADYFKSQYRKVDLNTIYNYLAALESTYIISKVKRYDVQGKEILKTLEKYYIADQGIQHAVLGYRDRNISGVLENIVYNELLRRGYNVYIGKLSNKEIDFIAEAKNEKLYIQVTYKLESEATIEREFAPLLAIKDHYPKFVVSMDDNFSDNIEGVRHIKLLDFLLK